MINTEHNFVIHTGNGVITDFDFDFTTYSTDHIQVLEDGVPTSRAYSVALNTDQENNPGGTVSFTTAPGSGVIFTIVRVVPSTQDMSYGRYDPFPSKSHERALDKLTMVDQQLGERVESALRMPVGDTADVVLPADRALKYMFFDEDGNASVIEVDPDPESLRSIRIAPDSTTMLKVDNSQDAQRPFIGIENINKPSGILQLNSQGKVPVANLGFGGIQLLGPFRGDDLCDKRGDNPGDCTEPDYRNPSERFPDLVPSGPNDTIGKFNTGDTFLLTFQEPEVSGNMNLYLERGGVESVVAVGQRDAIVFLTGWDADGVDIPDLDMGWYYVPKLSEIGDATNITYSPDGNYILDAIHNNVQLAVDYIDKNAVDIQARNQTIDGNKTFVEPVTQQAEGTGPNHLMRKVDIEALFEGIFPVGAYYIGPDPNGRLPGTWAQLAEGTFLMNTINDADPSGGSNDAAVINHTHPATTNTTGSSHDHFLTNNDGWTLYTNGLAQGGGSDIRIPNITNFIGSRLKTQDSGTHTHGVSVSEPANGVSGAGQNRPRYRGVPIWTRTA